MSKYGNYNIGEGRYTTTSRFWLVAGWRKSVAAVGGDCSVNTGGGRVVTSNINITTSAAAQEP